MDFDYKLKNIRTDALTLEYFFVPWDTEILKQPVAEISKLEVCDLVAAEKSFATYTTWATEHAIEFCHCRIRHSLITESLFLQTQDFKFIELNYRPSIDKLQTLNLPNDTICIQPATEDDHAVLASMAGSIYKYGRFHQDPRLGVELGNLRYKYWLLNAFELPQQQVFKCLLNHQIIAFFVVEYPEKDRCFWSLVGLAPGMGGIGLGKRVWQAMMYKHQQEGIETITTSISSHNTAVLNLYVSLAFRFPPPLASFHWRPASKRP